MLGPDCTIDRKWKRWFSNFIRLDIVLYLTLIHGKNLKIFLKDEKLRKKFSGRPTLVQYWLGLIIPPASIISWHSQVSTHMRVLENWKI